MDESITQAILPGEDGFVGVLTDRAPLLMKLGAGPLRIDRARSPPKAISAPVSLSWLG